MANPRIAVHKFSSCDGCQLAFLNAGEALLELAGMVDILHFAEAGPNDPDAPVDIAFVEGSISTPEEAERIRQVRANSRHLLTIGACATAGGLQALRNLYADSVEDWTEGIYASRDTIQSLEHALPIRAHVRVDFELWGCPITTEQLVAAVRSLLFGVTPPVNDEPVCMSCKRRGTACVMVTQGQVCMGPVTHSGCGALCPAFGRGCYGCFGPLPHGNADALANRLAGLGLMPDAVRRHFHLIASHAEPFRQAGLDAEEGKPS